MEEGLIEDPRWERKTLEKLLFLTLKEQRRRRRWGLFFKLTSLVFFFGLLATFWLHPEGLTGVSRSRPHASLVDLSGAIVANAASNADDIISGLREAFQDEKTLAIVLRINSPGGSPVQASQIYDEIRYLRTKHPKTKVYAVCDDLCVSAAYYIAAASDEIYASPASLVGSIGVLIDDFGFSDTLKRLGIERRLLTSGQHKGFLDPFSPLKPSDVQLAQGLIDEVHQQFIQAVKQGRGHRLHSNNSNVFSGLAWTGQQARALGLIDGLGDLNTVARLRVKSDNIVDYTVRPRLFQRLSNYVAASFTHQIKMALGLSPSGFHYTGMV